MSVTTYIGSSFSNVDVVLGLVPLFRKKGFSVLDGWTRHRFPHEGGMVNPDNLEYGIKCAVEDRADILASELVVIISDPHEGSKYGWLDERGMALGSILCQELWMVGPPVNIFGLMKGLQDDGLMIRQFPDVASMVNYLNYDGRDNE